MTTGPVHPMAASAYIFSFHRQRTACSRSSTSMPWISSSVGSAGGACTVSAGAASVLANAASSSSSIYLRVQCACLCSDVLIDLARSYKNRFSGIVLISLAVLAVLPWRRCVPTSTPKEPKSTPARLRQKPNRPLDPLLSSRTSKGNAQGSVQLQDGVTQTLTLPGFLSNLLAGESSLRVEGCRDPYNADKKDGH